MFACFQGTFRCMKCGTVSETVIQTYLFKTDYGNAMRAYGVGESEVIDGLDEFYPLYPWNGQAPRNSAALDGVHLVETELARLNGNYGELAAAWSSRPVEQRCSLVVTGFRKWCAQAGVDIDREPSTATSAGGM